MNLIRLVLLVVAVFPTAVASAADTVEFLSGAKLSGEVTQIRKSQQEFDFEAVVGSRTIARTIPFDKVHAVTMKGKRFTLNPLADTAERAEAESDGSVVRTPREIEQLIETEGSSVPDWFDSTELDYPDTLDLSWPLKPPDKGWNNQKNMGQYIWDIIHPNPSRWRSGIKLIHHCMSLHKDNPTLLQRDMQTVGRMYFELLQDYPRAAYWLRKSRAEKGDRPGVMLAECYWRLGNKSMALDQLTARTYRGHGAIGTVKLYGNMGELDKAVRLTEAIGRTAVADQGYLALADALRQAGRFDDAIGYYRRVLASDQFRNDDYEKRFKARAQESIESIELFEKLDLSQISDGKYRGSSTGYNGRLDVEVAVDRGRIGAVKVIQHREKQFYSALTDTEQQIVQRQSLQDVDGTSGATITSQAIVNAAAKALADGGSS